MTTIAFTGHRPKDMPGITYAAFAAVLDRVLGERHDQLRFVTGGALGTDTWAAQYAIAHQIPLTIILPFRPNVMSKFWHPEDVAMLWFTVSKAEDVQIILDTGAYSPWAYQRRNEEMVNRADILFAMWSGKMNGGTFNCLRYAKERGCPVTHLYAKVQREIRGES